MLEISLFNNLCYLKVHSVSFYIQLALTCANTTSVFEFYTDTWNGCMRFVYLHLPLHNLKIWYFVTFQYTTHLCNYHSWSQSQPFCTLVCASTWLPVAILWSVWVLSLQWLSWMHFAVWQLWPSCVYAWRLMFRHLFPICGVRAADCLMTHDRECLFGHFMFPFKLTVFGLTGGSHTYPHHRSGLSCWLELSNVLTVVCTVHYSIYVCCYIIWFFSL